MTFIFQNYPEDIEPLIEWLEGLKGASVISRPKMTNGDMPFHYHRDGKIIGTAFIPAIIHEKLSYNELSHIIQRLLWIEN